jgi:hypothetical protein
VRRFLIAIHLCFAAVIIAPCALAVSPPTFSPAPGLYFPGPTVTLSASSGATVFYTVDGTVPTLSSQSGGPVTLNGTTTINAIAVQSGVSSTVATAVYTVDPTIQGLQSSSQLLWLRSDVGVTSSSGSVSTWVDSAAGNNATQSSSSNQPSIVSNDCNGYPGINFGGSQFFNLPSDFAAFSYPALYFAAKPTNTSTGVLVDLGSGSVSDNVTGSSNGSASTFTINQGSSASSITASSALTLGQYQSIGMMLPDSGSGIGQIYVNGVQTGSGSLNTANNITRSNNHIGTDYSGSANYYSGGLLEVLAYGNGSSDPDIVNAYFLNRYQMLNVIPAAPIISVPTGTLAGATQVAIATPPDCTCYLTQDGSTPSSSSPQYNGPITIYYSQTLKAISIKSGMSSSVASATYTLDSTQWPAPNPSDTTPLQVNIQSPN